MHTVTSEEERALAVSSELVAHLTRFNELEAGPLNRRDVALTIRNERGTLIAGLAGEMFWNALYVHQLWVDADHRRRGYGAQLLQRAEALAREASRDCSYLSTFEFQAPAFYAKQGYSVIGELRGVPIGSRRQWFSKQLR